MAAGNGPFIHPQDRARYDEETIYRILDEGFVCHVGFVHDGGTLVIPTGYARLGRPFVYTRIGSEPYAANSRSRRSGMCHGVDSLVFARSAFQHSINYGSALIFGTATAVTDESEKMEAQRLFTERMIPEPLERDPPSQRPGAEGTLVSFVADRRSFLKSSYRPSRGRPAGLCPARLGWSIASEADAWSAGKRPSKIAGVLRFRSGL